MENDNLKINSTSNNPVFTDTDLASTPNFLNYLSFLIKDLLFWWYVQMPIYYLKKLNRVSIVVSDQLSIPILIRYFFIPWKRHHAAVGYFIGITTKLLYLPIAILIYLIAISIYSTLILGWLFIPLVAIFFTLISLFL